VALPSGATNPPRRYDLGFDRKAHAAVVGFLSELTR